MKVPNCDVRDAYRRAIAKVWGLKQKDIKRDIHIGSHSPGQWSPDSAVEIYCEGNIPNATDHHYSEFGTFYHCENWNQIDDLANSFIQKKHPGAQRFYHSPYNNAVVSIWPV